MPPNLEYANSLYNTKTFKEIIITYAAYLRRLLKRDPEIVGIVSSGSSGA